MNKARVVRAPRGSALHCKNWLIEAPYRMIQNNLDPEVAQRPQDLQGVGAHLLVGLRGTRSSWLEIQ